MEFKSFQVNKSRTALQKHCKDNLCNVFQINNLLNEYHYLGQLETIDIRCVIPNYFAGDGWLGRRCDSKYDAKTTWVILSIRAYPIYDLLTCTVSCTKHASSLNYLYNSCSIH